MKNLSFLQEALENSRNLQSRAGELESRAGTRAATRQGTSQQATKTQRYRYVLPPKPEPLHQWFDLQNKHIHHEARSLDRLYSNERKDNKKEFWQR